MFKRLVLVTAAALALVSLVGRVRADDWKTLQKKISICCAQYSNPHDFRRGICIAQAWRDYYLQHPQVAGGGPSNVYISSQSTGYRGATPEGFANTIYNHGAAPVTVVVDVDPGATVLSARLVLVDPTRNPLPGFCSNGTNAAGPFCNEDSDCGGGNTCTGVRMTCQGGGNNGNACANDGACPAGTCERTIGQQLATCSDTGSNTWSCTFVPNAAGSASTGGSFAVEFDIQGSDLDTDGNVAGALAGTERRYTIPTVSEWGVVAMTLLFLTAATLVLVRHRARRIPT